MNIEVLYDTDNENEKNTIKKKINDDIIFVLDNENTELCTYIEYLYDSNLGNKILSRLKMCKNIKFDRNVQIKKNEFEGSKPEDMKDLLVKLNKGDNIIVLNNSRVLLAEIVQQLIYIDYPLQDISISLEKEFADAKKSDKFIKNLDKLESAVESGNKEFIDYVERLGGGNDDFYEMIGKVKTSYALIKEKIQEAKDVEIEVAVAASKKTGKSVIVNSMIGEELAPTSLEKATPNTCVYKKSPDDNYHLQYDGYNESFCEKKDIYKVLNDKFKEAEASKSLTLPDMEILYRSRKSNFEAYTVYDTPGPDLAGQTGHRESAYKIINKCDVAVFAIDYTKYLTDTEMEYLQDIKTVFDKNEKFYSLIFVINKIDQALGDKGAKSRIKSIDFIRDKLCRIDERYRECIVFATSARDYFYSLELEEAAENDERLSDLLEDGCDWYNDVANISDEIEEDDVDENIVDLLSSIDSEVRQIKKKLGYSRINMNTFRQYSGMPQFMNYLSYVVKSKSREEIINAIEYNIDMQIKAIKLYIDEIHNVETLLNKTNEEIYRINSIIDSYEKDISDILGFQLTQEDYDRCEDKGAIKQYIKKKSIAIPTGFEQIFDDIRGATKKPYEKDRISNELWHRYNLAQMNKLENMKGKVVSVDDIPLDESTLRELIRNWYRESVEELRKECSKNLEQLTKDLNDILRNRYEKLKERSKQCSEELQRNDYDLKLPNIPDFTPSIPNSSTDLSHVDEIHINMDLSGLGRNINFIARFLRWLTGKGGAVKIPAVKDIIGKLDDSKSDFINEIKNNKVSDMISEEIKKEVNSIDKVYEINKNAFKEANIRCKDNIAEFKKQIDSREAYKNDTKKFEAKKKFIEKLRETSSGYMEVWNMITENEK